MRTPFDLFKIHASALGFAPDAPIYVTSYPTPLVLLTVAADDLHVRSEIGLHAWRRLGALSLVLISDRRSVRWFSTNTIIKSFLWYVSVPKWFWYQIRFIHRSIRAIFMLYSIALASSMGWHNQFLFEVIQECCGAQEHSVPFGTNSDRVCNWYTRNTQVILMFFYTLRLI
jgi:hypothetical protein